MKELTVSDLASMSRGQAEEAIRERVQTVYLGQGRALTRVLGRLKLYLSTEDQGFAGHVMLDGYWESWLTLFVARSIKSGMTVVDVGANFGYYTLLFGEAVGPTGQVIAIEPVPETADLLERSVRLNGFAERTRVVRAALGAETAGEAHIYVPSGEPKNAAVVHLDAGFPHTIKVPTTNLDSLATDYKRVDLIKIDAEGAEANIFAGMQAVIARHRPAVILEFNAARYPDPNAFLEGLLACFACPRAITFDGSLEAVSPQALLTTRVGEDWLLYLEV